MGKQISKAPSSVVAAIHPKPETRTQHEPDRHEQPDDARIVALDVIDRHGEDGRLIGLRTEIARRVANIFVGRLIVTVIPAPLRCVPIKSSLMDPAAAGTGRLRLVWLARGGRIGVRVRLLGETFSAGQDENAGQS